MKVLHIATELSPQSGGPTRSIPGLCRALSGRGDVEATLFVHSAEGLRPDLLGSRYPVGIGTGLAWNSVRRDTHKVIARVRPAIVHLHGLWMLSNHFDASFARRHSIPTVISPRGMLEPWSLNAKKWKKQLALWLYQRRDLERVVALHATAESEAEQFRRLGLKQPIIVSPNGVDFPEYMPPKTYRADGKMTALFLSRIHPKKGLMELVEAWANVRSSKVLTCESCKVGECARPGSSILNWHFEYAGPDYDGHLATVQRRMRDLGVERDFTYLGHLNDQEKWVAYRRADLFVLPTYSENFGIVVAEALAAEAPVLTTTGTPWKSLVENRCGWCIEPGLNPLEKELPFILQCGRDELQEMGRRGRAYAYKTFDWNRIANEMKQAYEWVLNR